MDPGNDYDEVVIDFLYAMPSHEELTKRIHKFLYRRVLLYTAEDCVLASRIAEALCGRTLSENGIEVVVGIVVHRHTKYLARKEIDTKEVFLAACAGVRDCLTRAEVMPDPLCARVPKTQGHLHYVAGDELQVMG